MSENLHTYLMKGLKKQLLYDIENCYVFTEADLQACVYNHIKRFLSKIKGKMWHVHCGLEDRAMKKPDIVIWEISDNIGKSKN